MGIHDIGLSQDNDTREQTKDSTKFRIHFRGVPGARFNFDQPSAGVLTRHKDLGSTPVLGWAFVPAGEKASLCLRYEDGRDVGLPLNYERPDVVRHFDNQGIACDLMSGIKAAIDFRGLKSMHLVSGKEERSLCTVELEKISQVLIGVDDWLFLKNDTNRSVEIFTGALPFSRALEEKWASYLSTVSALVPAGRSCFVVAPSKEDVHPEFYPQTPARYPALNRLLSVLDRSGVPFSCPIAKLRQEPGAYYKTDTHWSDFGAMVAFEDVLSAWGFKLDIRSLLTFDDVQSIGDLGSKLHPELSDAARTLVEDKDRIKVEFHNRFQTTGSIGIYMNASPVIDESIVIFGDSFCGQMQRTARNIFRRTVRVVTPSVMPIREVLDAEKPDRVIMQTNGRYCMTVPVVGDRVVDVHAIKQFVLQSPSEAAGLIPSQWIR